MASMNVYKPPQEAIYTKKATPDQVLPIPTRHGKVCYLYTPVAPGTYTLYTKPAGVRARLIYYLIMRVDSGMDTEYRIDDQAFFYLEGFAAMWLNSTPQINLTYENGIEINKGLTLVISAPGNNVRLMAIVVEDDLSTA